MPALDYLLPWATTGALAALLAAVAAVAWRLGEPRQAMRWLALYFAMVAAGFAAAFATHLLPYGGDAHHWVTAADRLLTVLDAWPLWMACRTAAAGPARRWEAALCALPP